MNENNNNNSLNFSNNDEIINNQSQNSHKKKPIIHSKEKQTQYKACHALYYIAYMIIIISIYVLFFINYLKTNNWYKDNIHYINLNPISICENYIKKSEACLKDTQKKSSNVIKKQGDKYVFDSAIICKEDNDKLQICIDSVNLFREGCQIYLNELSLCKNNGKQLNNCMNKNIANCLKAFNYVNITKVFEDL